MKTTRHLRSAWLILATALVSLFLLAPHIHAADTPVAGLAAPSAGITAENIIAWLTPILVPLIIAGMKFLAPKIPGWLLPILAPVLGIAIDALGSLATGQAGNVWMAALLGLAGVGLREAKDQLGKSVPPKDPSDQ